MKGLSAVIAVVLLVIITVALVGVVATSFQSLTQNSAQQAQKQTDATSDRLSQIIRIESASSSRVVIRSIGISTVQTNKTAVFIDGVIKGCAWDVTQITQDGLGTCTYINGTCATGSEVRITSPGNSHTAKC